MILDIYCYADTDSAKFFDAPQEGGMVWLEGSKGFGSGYFTNKETDEIIQFVSIPKAGALPTTPAEFENLPFIEAQILEPSANRAKVKLLSVHSLGEWARRVRLTKHDVLSKVPDAIRPTDEKCDEINNALRMKGQELWVSDDKAWENKDKVNAIYFFKSEFDKRGLILTTNGAASYLVVAGD